jgi:hypothetical protein
MIEQQSTSNVISVYNDMGLKILRLDDNWKTCISARRHGEYSRLAEELGLIWDEIYPLVIKNKYKHMTDFYKKIDETISRTKTKGELKKALDTKYRFLKHVQDRVGLGTKTRRDSDEEEEMDY